MSIDREIVATRLSKLREALRHLKGIAAKTREAYLSSDTDRALSEHYLRLALEAMLDAGNHIIAARGLRKPLQLREIPLVLADDGFITPELSRRLARATGLRNRLVHVYADIDHNLLFEVLQRDLPDLEAFAVAVGRAVDAESRHCPP
jgi:uncharacterized protein YutE (UPF0331/DUF86 family)